MTARRRMGSQLATVIIPTFDHVQTLRHSVASVLAQTHEQLEVFVIGDGAPAASADLIAEIAADDPRVTFCAYPKSDRTGEAHRHDVLTRRAHGVVALYLSDDDLWLPDHVETMLECMREHDASFVTCQPLWIRPRDEPAQRWIVDLSRSWYRDELLAGRNRVPLSCGAHTMQLYRSLPHGWRSTPEGVPTDLYMWQQLLSHGDCHAASTSLTTVLGLPSTMWEECSMLDRVAELQMWMPLTDAANRDRALSAAQSAVPGGLLEHAQLEAAHVDTLATAKLALHQRDVLRSEVDVIREEVASVRAQVDTLRADLQAAHERIEAGEAELAAARDSSAAIALQRDAATREIQAMLHSPAWQKIERLRQLRDRVTRR